MKKGDIQGLYVPLITPMLYGKFDKESMERLMQSVDMYVDGYVPCLSSGEGQFLSDAQWQEVVACVRSQTTKPLFPGIIREKIDDVIRLENIAAEMGCDGVTVLVPYNDISKNTDYFTELLNRTTLPCIIYNTETTHVSTLHDLGELDRFENILAIKDSSMNKSFFEDICNGRTTNELSMSVLQGMEHLLNAPKGCDGYLVSLLNTEPALVREMYDKPTESTSQRIIDCFWKYNLGGNWYTSLKAILFQRGELTSCEVVTLAIKPTNL